MRSNNKHRALHKYTVYAVILLVAIYGGGLVSLSQPDLRPVFMRLVPYNLLVSAALLALFNRPYSKKLLLTLLEVMVAGYALELAGVKTGIIFGEYVYGKTLGWKLWEVPVIIGVNWALLVYMTYSIFRPVHIHWVLKSLAGALLMLVYDFVMEPVAVELHFWKWNDGEIPVLNYVAWGAAAFGFHLLLHVRRTHFTNPLAPYLFFMQLLFFLILNVTYA